MAKANISKSSQHDTSTVGPGQNPENRGTESPPERPVRQRQRNLIRPTAAGAPASTGRRAVNGSDCPPYAKSDTGRTVASIDNAPGSDTPGEAPDYTVGYRRPPKHTQFSKGQSGNPVGRPRGSKNFQNIYLQERDARIGIKENGQHRMASKFEVAVKRMFNDAANGNAKARSDMLKLEVLLGINNPPLGTSAILTEDSGSQDERDVELLAELQRILIQQALAEAHPRPGTGAEGPSECAELPTDTSDDSEDCSGDPGPAELHGDAPKPTTGQLAQECSGEDDDRPVHRPLRTFRDGEWIQR